jgi:4'-phosphopantetheinyl transferase
VAAGWETHPAVTPLLGDAEVHVWACDLDASSLVTADAEGVLSEDELYRAERFRFERDRRRFILARAWLRSLVGSYAGVAPRELAFSYSEFGKPSLAAGSVQRAERLHFNMSGSDAMAIIGLRLDCELGVDLERLRAFEDAVAVSRRMFSAEEHRQIAEAPEETRTSHFFRYWTRKEALVKSLDTGIFQPLTQVLSVLESEADAIERVELDSEGARFTQWLVPLRAPAEGYMAALATAARPGRVRCWQSPPAPPSGV